MLRRIRIQNHALIEQVELHLNEGFHVFTEKLAQERAFCLVQLGYY